MTCVSAMVTRINWPLSLATRNEKLFPLGLCGGEPLPAIHHLGTLGNRMNNEHNCFRFFRVKSFYLSLSWGKTHDARPPPSILISCDFPGHVYTPTVICRLYMDCSLSRKLHETRNSTISNLALLLERYHNSRSLLFVSPAWPSAVWASLSTTHFSCDIYVRAIAM